jgi:hypothetical protein
MSVSRSVYVGQLYVWDIYIQAHCLGLLYFIRINLLKRDNNRVFFFKFECYKKLLAVGYYDYYDYFNIISTKNIGRILIVECF